MNLAPLYRLNNEREKKMIADLVSGKTTDFDINEIHQLCKENNWGKKFENKYNNCMQNVPKEMCALLEEADVSYSPLQQLIEEITFFSDAKRLHEEIEKKVIAMLEQKKDIALALQILFYIGKSGKTGEESGTISVVLDSRRLIDDGVSVVTDSFTNLLNEKLVEADFIILEKIEKNETDAFGEKFGYFNENMPTVKLAAGFEVILRTMYDKQFCHYRYGRANDASYPISKEKRYQMQSSLAWLSSERHKGITWISIGHNEVLFAYPHTLQKNMFSLVNFCKGNEIKDTKKKKVEFETAAKAFISEIKKTKQPGTDVMSERIQYFVLRKLDKARAKVVYTYNTSAAEIEYCSENWSLGCQNLPSFKFGQPATLFPLEISDVLNTNWRMDGKPSTDKFKPISQYYGMELLFKKELSVVRRDLFVLMSNVMNLAPYLGKLDLISGKPDKSISPHVHKALAFMGLLLYRLDIRKETYMQDFPYLFGQLLKVSDALHEMYCKVVRKNDVPNALAGSSLYISGSEHPYRTLAVLGQRMNPYITWAKTYKHKKAAEDSQKKAAEDSQKKAAEDSQKKDADEKQKKATDDSWRAGWYLSLYENIATQLYKNWGNQKRFNEEEKAQYFIGYLADFPKKENNYHNFDQKTEDEKLKDE